ncbi:Putative cytosolic protein (plasmid) [Borrelia coriaceae ATCC 43381]|uniref:Putative cytosolic protein n=2 Tax=Borrelia coriaceae TaxID=144 RepID=W5SWT9_9SPIR|nr:Putative cytosolic protein [Borrelia coriaceae ATCC 43381]
MMDFFTFGVDKRQKYKFFIAFRGLFNQSKVELFSLFALKDDDKFLGIYYGYRKPIQNLVTRYEENGVTKSSTFSKVYYVEFRFKKGSVFCYIKGIAYLLKKEKIDTKYYKSLLEKLINLEKQVYEFYNEKLSDGSFINKWIIKRQK